MENTTEIKDIRDINRDKGLWMKTLILPETKGKSWRKHVYMRRINRLYKINRILEKLKINDTNSTTTISITI